MTGDDGGGEPVKGYFRKIRSEYQDSVERETIAGVHRRIREVVEPALRGVVLDLGSGGVTDYRTGRIDFLISMDNVLEFLKNSRNDAAADLCGDVTAVPLRGASVDFIVMQHVLHHLTGPSYGQNLRNVRAAAAEARRILKPGGVIFVVDSMVPASLEVLEAGALPVVARRPPADGKADGLLLLGGPVRRAPPGGRPARRRGPAYRLGEDERGQPGPLPLAEVSPPENPDQMPRRRRPAALAAGGARNR